MAVFNLENADVAFKKCQIKYFISYVSIYCAHSSFHLPPQIFLLLG